MADTNFLSVKKESYQYVSSDLWPDILNRISRISKGLNGIGPQTEKDFIALGQTLMEGDSAGRAIETKAIEIVSVTEGEQETKALSFMKENVGLSLSRFQASKENIKNQFVSVKNVLAHLSELQSKNDDIDRLARYLRAVALNIFIETSRSNVLSDNFSIIAKEIKQLSEDIVNLSKTVNTTVDEAKKRFSTLYTNTQQGVTELDQVSEDAGQTVQKAVSMTDGWLDLAGKTAAKAVNMGHELAGHVGKIVMALQFHDAMRQRIEHIVTGLSDIASLYKKNTDPGTEADSESLSTAHAMASLLSDHMEHMIVEIGDVYSQCSHAFDAIERGIGTIAEEVTSLVGGDGNGPGRLGDDAGRHLLSSIQSLGSLRSRGMNLVERMNDIYAVSIQTTSTLTDLTGKIHNISMDAHIKGINAIIAASNLGNEGRTLTVLAAEMKKLADLVDIFVKDVEAIIRQVASDMDTPKQADESDGDKELDDTMMAIINMVNTMKNQAGDLHNNMETMDKIHRRVKQELQVIPAMGNDLSVQKKNLSELLTFLAPFADRRGKEKLAGSSMIGRYTMEKERQIHRTSLSESHETRITNNPVETHELGDNVELF